MKTREAIRPLTKLMIQKLVECQKMEEDGIPCLPKHFSASLSGLYKRKFVDVRPRIIDGKEIMCAYITSTGMEYLSSLPTNNNEDY